MFYNAKGEVEQRWARERWDKGGLGEMEQRWARERWDKGGLGRDGTKVG